MHMRCNVHKPFVSTLLSDIRMTFPVNNFHWMAKTGIVSAVLQQKLKLFMRIFIYKIITVKQERRNILGKINENTSFWAIVYSI